MSRSTRPDRRSDLREVDPDVAAFLDGVRTRYRQEVPNEVVAGHLRAILTLAMDTPDTRSARARWASRLRRVGALTTVKVAAGATVAVAAAGGGLAATGNLPPAVQQVVSDAGARVGVQIPGAAEVDTPGVREDQPGIGGGGVPALLEEEPVDLGEVPGRAEEAPGHNRDDEGVPLVPAPQGPPEELPGQADDAAGDKRPDDPGQPAGAGGTAEGTGDGDDAPGRSGDRPDGPPEDAGTAQERPASSPSVPGSRRVKGS
jgi:hypothetical protein